MTRPTERGDKDKWLEERVGYWQRLLRLEDWRIGCKWCHHYQIGDEDSVPLAQVEIDVRHKHGLVKVLMPDERTPVEDLNDVDPLHDELEVSIVHELLPVSLAEQDFAVPDEIKKTDPFWLGSERHIVNLSKALVTLDRGET